MKDGNVPTRVIISGLTASGKSTHARLLAARSGATYVSMRPLMSEVMSGEHPATAGGEWRPEVDAVRARDDRFDREADRLMLARCRSAPGVFDAWALPWLYREPGAVRVWIEASLESRIERCMLSGAAADEAEARCLLEAKDSFSRSQFRRLYGIELGPDPGVFEVIVENSSLLGELSEARAATDIARFHRHLGRQLDEAHQTAS